MLVPLCRYGKLSVACSELCDLHFTARVAEFLNRSKDDWLAVISHNGNFKLKILVWNKLADMTAIFKFQIMILGQICKTLRLTKKNAQGSRKKIFVSQLSIFT